MKSMLAIVLASGIGGAAAAVRAAEYHIAEHHIPGVRSWGEAGYDKDGNLEKRVDKLAGQERQYRYDAMGRLDTAAGPFERRDYDYDKNGNRLRLAADSAVQTYTYRVLMAQAKVESLTLMSNDGAFKDYGVKFVW